MKKIILISLLCLLLFTGCQKPEENIEENNIDSSVFETFDVIESNTQTYVDTSGLEKQLEQQAAISDMNHGPDGEFIFTEDHKKIDIRMKENIYLDMFDDIFLTPSYYMGKTICVEGMYTVWSYHDGSSYNYVYRNGPDGGCPCCGGSFYGLEFTWDGELPKENDWIEVVGVMDEYIEDGFPYLTLRCVSVKVLDKRGKEDLTQ